MTDPDHNPQDDVPEAMEDVYSPDGETDQTPSPDVEGIEAEDMVSDDE